MTTRDLDSLSIDTISPIVVAFASNAWIRATLARCVVSRAAMSMTWLVTSCVETVRLCSLPSRAIAASVASKRSADTRSVSVAVDCPASICRSSPPRYPPAASARASACVAA